MLNRKSGNICRIDVKVIHPFTQFAVKYASEIDSPNQFEMEDILLLPRKGVGAKWTSV